jgi:hypothetical protein
MPKPAQEWQEQLELDDLPAPEFLDALNDLEGLETIDATSSPATFIEMTPDQLREALVDVKR